MSYESAASGAFCAAVATGLVGCSTWSDILNYLSLSLKRLVTGGRTFLHEGVLMFQTGVLPEFDLVFRSCRLWQTPTPASRPVSCRNADCELRCTAVETCPLKLLPLIVMRRSLKVAIVLLSLVSHGSFLHTRLVVCTSVHGKKRRCPKMRRLRSPPRGKRSFRRLEASWRRGRTLGSRFDENRKYQANLRFWPMRHRLGVCGAMDTLT